MAGRLSSQCKDTDQACYGLIQDLKQRGLLDESLVIWGAEFGWTIYSQGGLTKENYDRDHYPRFFTMWMAGGGSKPGTIYGETDKFPYNVVKDPQFIFMIFMRPCCTYSVLTTKNSRIDIKGSVNA